MLELSCAAGIGVVSQPVTAEKRYEHIEQLRFEITDATLTLPENEAMLEDLVSVQRKVTDDGVRIVMPDGMGGFVRTLSLALAYPPALPKPEPVNRDEFEDAIIARVRAGQTGEGAWEGLFGEMSDGVGGLGI